MKRCPVCLEQLFAKPGNKEFYECGKCGNKIPKSVALENTTLMDPAITLYNDNYLNAMAVKVLLALGAATAVFFVTPSVKGPDFLLFYVLGAIIAFPASMLIAQAVDAPGEAAAIALWTIESAGASRILVGLAYGMANFDNLILLMGVAYVIYILLTARSNFGSHGGGGCGSSCSLFASSCGGSSCGGGCGGGCGGCGGS